MWARTRPGSLCHGRIDLPTCHAQPPLRVEIVDQTTPPVVLPFTALRPNLVPPHGSAGQVPALRQDSVKMVPAWIDVLLKSRPTQTQGLANNEAVRGVLPTG